jgi:putative peptidoglycan lipid II flippase
MRFKQVTILSNYWQKFTTGSVSRQIFGAALIVGLFTALVKVAAMAKELVIAWRFGTGDSVDAFLIALEFPALIINVISNSFAPALIPVYIKLQEKEGHQAAHKLLSGVLVCAIALLGITTILMVATAPLYLPWIASGFTPEKLRLTFYLLCAIAPFTLLSGFSVIWGAVLNARERFALASLLPILIPFVTIILLFVAQSWGMFALAAGLVIGTVLEITFLAVSLRRQGIPLLPKWNGWDQNLRQVAVQYLPIVAGALLICSASPIDNTMAAMLPAGSVASLNYGHRLISSSISLISTALSAAVIPYFAKMIAYKDWQEVKHTLKQYTRLIFFSTIPLTGVFIIFSRPIVQLVFQRGFFSAEDTDIVAQIQSLYALKIPFYLGDLLLLRLINSMRQNHILSLVSGFNLIVNISLNYIFMQWIGVKGIALSTSFIYIFSFLILFAFVNRKLAKY